MSTDCLMMRHFQRLNRIRWAGNLNKDGWVSPKKKREDVLEEVGPWESLEHGRVTFLWQRATPVIAGCFACRTLKKMTISGILGSIVYTKLQMWPRAA